MVKSLFDSPVPVVEIEAPAAKIPNMLVTVREPAKILQFLIVLFVAPKLVPKLATQIAVVFIAVEVFSIVKLLSVPPLLLPSIMI